MALIGHETLNNIQKTIRSRVEEHNQRIHFYFFADCLLSRLIESESSAEFVCTDSVLTLRWPRVVVHVAFPKDVSIVVDSVRSDYRPAASEKSGDFYDRVVEAFRRAMASTQPQKTLGDQLRAYNPPIVTARFLNNYPRLMQLPPADVVEQRPANGLLIRYAAKNVEVQLFSVTTCPTFCAVNNVPVATADTTLALHVSQMLTS